MTLGNFRGVRVKPVLVLAGAAVLALPADAFGCWNLCVQTTGYYREMYGTTWELNHCVQSWPDGASSPSTTRYYRRFIDIE